MESNSSDVAGGVPTLVGGTAIVLAFFLPMIRGCGFADASAAQVASEYPEYYLYIVVGLVALVAGIVMLIAAGSWQYVTAGIAGTAGLLHLVARTIHVKANDDFGMLEPLVGYYVLILGFAFLCVYPWIAWARFRAGRAQETDGW